MLTGEALTMISRGSESIQESIGAACARADDDQLYRVYHYCKIFSDQSKAPSSNVCHHPHCASSVLRNCLKVFSVFSCCSYTLLLPLFTLFMSANITFWKMVEIPMKYTIFFLIFLAAFTESRITTLDVVEGDIAFLNFSYSCNSTKVTLQQGNGAPFYNSKGPNPPSFSNLKVRNETDGKICFLCLTINPVTRNDAGGYILTAYKDDPTQYEDDRILLLVGYPPGKASCSLSEEHIDPGWVRLQCTAPLGNIGGFIMCYQNGSKIPPLISPQQHGETLSQTLLAHVGSFVYCCSSTLDHTKDRCECKDSVWDPTQNKQVTNVSDPCPPTAPIQYSTFPQQPNEDDKFEVTSPRTKTLTPTPQRITCKALVGLIGGICLLILVTVISIRIWYYCMYKRHPKKSLSLKTVNHVEESFISDVQLETPQI